MSKLKFGLTVLVIAVTAMTTIALPCRAADKPNILVVWGDDVGLWNLSAYSRGGMGYRTPNIDRIAREGAIFADYYAQQSCTAGRAAFITGRSVFRTGLSKVGDSADVGVDAWSPVTDDHGPSEKSSPA